MLLYHSFTSPYARKVRVVLLEKGIRFDAIDVATTESPLSDINPLGKVPTLVLDNGTVLFDSAVITETLEALFPMPTLIPQGPLERAIVRRWEALADGLCDVVIPVILDARRDVSQQNPTYSDKLLAKVRAVLSYFDSHVSGRHFIVGESFSLADIAVVTALGYLALRKPELLEGHEGLSAYVARQLARPSLSTTVPPNLPVRG